MFCDMVGSSALSTQLDPEEQREVISAFQSACAAEIKRLDGMVAQYLGDGVLAYFGYPAGHEDDPERAVRAGLAIVDRIGTAAPGVALQARVGIASGVVVVGDLVHDGVTQENAAIGETTNLAARLQSIAEPNTVVIAPITHRLMGGLFEYRDLGRHALKGFAEPLHVRQVLGLSKVESRFDALNQSGPAPLLGRDEELQLMIRRWQQAVRGEGRVVLVTGEPGIGKSRLLRAVRDSLSSEEHTPLSYFCAPTFQDTALYPFIRQLNRAAGLERTDRNEQKLAKLASFLGSSSGDIAGDMPLLAALLSIPAGDRYPLPDMTAKRRKERTFDVLLHVLNQLAVQQPLLMVFEDLHWIDPTSLELLSLAIDHIQTQRILLIATARPEFTPPWPSHPHISTVSLNRLGHPAVRALIEGVTQTKSLPTEVVDQILTRCDGVPLFVEELTKTILESGLLRETANGYELTGHLPPLAIPSTLHASLLARLDRLAAAAKSVAQVGAVIGREFLYTLLAPVAALPEVGLRDALSQLVNAELIFQRGVPPDATYVFKHALVQDAAYASLMKSRRQQLHGAIARTLEEGFPEIVEIEPEIIAHHLECAGRSAEAIVYWRLAGEQAAHRAANLEAIGHLRRALLLLQAQPETAERWREELAVLSQLSPALLNVYGWSAPEVGDAVERAAVIGRRLESSAELAPSIANLWIFQIARGRYDHADEISNDLFRIARELDEPEILLQAHHTAWGSQWFRGLFTQASEHVDAGLRLYDKERHAHHRYVFLGHDPGVCALTIAAVVRRALGYPVQGRCFEGRAITLARGLQHAPSLAHALWHVCEAQAARGDCAAVIATARELLELGKEYGLLQHQAFALIFLGWAQARSGEVAEGMGRLEEGFAILSKISSRGFLTNSLCLMGECLLVAHRCQEGLERVAQALDLASELGEGWYVSRLHQVRAELLLAARGANDEAVEASLQQGLNAARRQCAKGWELPAATSLSRLWRDQGKCREARELLEPVYRWFTEGFDTPDLLQAKELLDQLQ